MGRVRSAGTLLAAAPTGRLAYATRVEVGKLTGRHQKSEQSRNITGQPLKVENNWNEITSGFLEDRVGLWSSDKTEIVPRVFLPNSRDWTCAGRKPFPS